MKIFVAFAVAVFSTLCLLAIAKSESATDSSIPCVECGKAGKDCKAASITKGTAYTLKFVGAPNPNATDQFSYAVATSKNYVIFKANAFNDIKTLNLANMPPENGEKDWPVPANQRALWRVQTKTLTRYYYLSGFDQCLATWGDQSFGTDTKMTVYEY